MYCTCRTSAAMHRSISYDATNLLCCPSHLVSYQCIGLASTLFISENCAVVLRRTTWPRDVFPCGHKAGKYKKKCPESAQVGANRHDVICCMHPADSFSAKTLDRLILFSFPRSPAIFYALLCCNTALAGFFFLRTVPLFLYSCLFFHLPTATILRLGPLFPCYRIPLPVAEM